MELIQTTGQRIALKETNDVAVLENQIKLLGMNGLFYSPCAQELRNKIKRLENKK